MTVKGGFYNSLAGDRKYDAIDFGSVFDGIITDGVFVNYGGHLVVTPQGSNMNVVVATGRAWFNHTWTLNDANLVITVDTSEVSLNRIDAIILEVDSSDAVRANSIKKLKGTPATTPVNPTLVNTSTKHQYALAYIYVGAGVTSILTGNITNNIGTTGCPFTTALLETLTVQELYARWESDQATLLAEQQTTFDTWFNALVDQLTGVQVTNLQNQINILTAQQNGWVLDSSGWTYVSHDGATGVANVSGNKTGIFKNGMRISYEQMQSLSAYWDLNANSNTQVGTFNGTDTAITYTAGKFSNAATFDGATSKIVIADHATLKPTADFTIGLWFKTSNTGANKDLFQSFSASTNAAGTKIQIIASNVLRCFTANNTGPSLGVNITEVIGTTVVTDGNWHYVVYTYKNNLIQLYLDGKLEGSGYGLAPAYAATNYLRIGCGSSTGSDTQFMNGQIDDLFIINGYALDEETIKAKYDANAAQGSSSILLSKKAIITNVGTYGGVNTPITFWGGTDFSLINGSITNIRYSTAKVPFGFNANPAKWRVMIYSNVDPNITTNTTTYQNALGLSIVVPIGLFNLQYSAGPNVTQSVAGTCQPSTTLSTTTSTETIPPTTIVTSIAPVTGYTSQHTLLGYMFNSIVKTTLYFLVKAGATATAVHYYSPLTITATLAYL